MRPLDQFCQLQIETHGSPQLECPEVMAQEWIAHSGLSALPSLSEIRRQMEHYGLSLQPAAVPDMRAHHYCHRGGDPTILYEDGDWRGAVEFTLLHEFYEIIIEQLHLVAPNSDPPSPERTCRSADRFAAAVLMQKDVFLQALYDSSFDIVWLHRHFHRSYSAVVIRAIQLLDRSAAGPDLACFIYQPDGNPRDENGLHRVFRVACAASTAGMRRRYPRRLLPRRKQAAQTGSIVDTAMNTGRSVLLERAGNSDPEGSQAPAFLARPVFWFKRPAKVILQAMPMEDRHFLETQAGRIDAKVMNRPDRPF